MTPIFGVRAPPLDPLAMDRRTVADLERVLAARLDGLASVNRGAGCHACRDAEAHAFLAQLRHLLQAIDAGPVNPGMSSS